MATTVRIPVDLRSPRVSTLAGNSFFIVRGLTAHDPGWWEFVQDVDGRIYGFVPVPANLAGTPNGRIVLLIHANATSGVTRLMVSVKAVADAESVNPASLTAEGTYDITVPGTAATHKQLLFPSSGALSETIAANDVLIVEIFHVGSHANDTLAANTRLTAAFLECDID